MRHGRRLGLLVKGYADIMDKTHAIIARLAGGVLLAFGIALGLLAVAFVQRQFASSGEIELAVAVSIVCVFMMSAFCSLMGYRLLLNRPNRYGSLFSPAGWRILAALFYILAVGLTSFSIWRGNYRLLVAPVGLGLLGYGCVIAGRRANIQPTPSLVFPPETSLLQREGFAPPGFRCGIEILNDDRTPMEFVVTMLCEAVGLSREDAIRTMLDVHTKGGLLLPTASPDESRRIADAVTARARSNNHPLICRAVGVDE
jgi:ATP-dependent Clp protease adapter protein ClpS